MANPNQTPIMEKLTKEEEKAKEVIAKKLLSGHPFKTSSYDFEFGAEQMFNLLWPLVREAIDWRDNVDTGEMTNSTYLKRKSEYLTNTLNKLIENGK